MAWLLVLSRFPVGSSASTIAGLPTRARAMATAGAHRRKAGSGEPRRADRDRPVRRASSACGTTLAQSDAGIKEAVGDVVENGLCARPRKNCWKTKPIACGTKPESSRSDSLATSSPVIRTVPVLGRSSVPMRCKSVDLPDPEGPTMATSSPL